MQNQPQIHLPDGRDFSPSLVSQALEDARVVADHCSYGQLQELFGKEPQGRQERLLSLVSDALCEYPQMCFGIPVLVYTYYSGYEDLHFPLPDYQPPESGITRCSWLGPSAFRDARPFGKQGEPLRLPQGTPVAAVLRVWCPSEHPPVIQDEWWGDLFRVIPGSVCMASKPAMPWPEALELATCMQANALSCNFPCDATPRLFLPHDAYAQAMLWGLEFARKVMEHDFGHYSE